MPRYSHRRAHGLFAKFGHECDIKSALHDLPMFKTDGNLFTRFRRGLRRARMISEVNKRGYNFLRSQKKIENEHRKHLSYPYVIHPFSDFRKYWEICMIIVYLTQFYIIPLEVAAHKVPLRTNIGKGGLFNAIHLTADFISLVDIGINFFSGYCNNKKKETVLIPSKIFKNYIFSYFLIDLLSSVSNTIEVIIMQYVNPISAYLHYFSTLRLLRYYTFMKYCKHFTETYDVSYAVHRVVVAITNFMTYLHVICCWSIIWTAQFTPYHKKYKNHEMILKSYGPSVDSFGILYARFFYSTCLMVLNAGYGMQSDLNQSKIFIVCVWIISRIVYITCIAYFMEFYSAIKSSSQKYMDMVSELKEYMRHRQLPEYIQKRMLTYYDIKFQRSYFRESEILNTISGQLRQEIIMKTCRKLVENVTFFKDLPITLLVRIVSCLRYEIYLTNDVITKAGAIGDSMYFIANGTVAIYTRSGKEICHLEDGDHFGEIALVMKDSARVATVIAIEVCELYHLDRKDYVRAILPYPDLFDKIQYVASERLERTDIMDEANRKEQFRKTQKIS